FVITKENLTVAGAGLTTVVRPGSPAVTVAANGVTVQDMLLAGVGVPDPDDVGILLDGIAAPDLTGVSIVNVHFSNLAVGVDSRGDIGDGNAATVDVTIRGNGAADRAAFEDMIVAAIDVGDTDGDARYLIRDIVLRDGGDVDPHATGGSGMIFGSVGGVEIRSVAFQDAAFTNGIVFDALAGAEVGIFDSTIRSDDDGISVKSLAGN